ncbi:BTB/POZ protein [Podospora australis]|uniref:Elongin-C n=1 Tax=Podospora australis TaxID=1536484 RepID=A0AAN6WY27_9PEZI|nr:BTB/POZ protein [Podospora australis]
MAFNGNSGNGAPSEYITLISSDDFEFTVLREAALISKTISRTLSNPMMEARTGVCHFPEIRGVVLEKVVEYFHYWYKHRDQLDVPDMPIPVELCLELLMAADYLGMDSKPASRDAF